MAKKATKPATNVFLIIRDREVRTALASELNEAGYNAIDYQTAREFLIDKPRHQSGVVIGEIRMLDMMGSELAQQLAAEKETFIQPQSNATNSNDATQQRNIKRLTNA